MKSKVKSMLAVAITGGLLMTYGGVVFANSDSTTTTQNNQTKQTQAHQGKAGQRPHNGIKLMEDNSEHIKTMLAGFVTDGTLTQADADNITAFLATQEAERKAEREKVALMTEDERKAYHEQKETTTAQPKLDTFSKMVTNGIITQAQADTITAKNEAERLATRQAEHKTQLETLVASNIITNEQVDQILAYQVTEDAPRKAEMEKVKAMTTEEREAYLTAAKGTHKEAMAGLVDEGILTQDQADAVAKVMGPAQRGGPQVGPMNHRQGK